MVGWDGGAVTVLRVTLEQLGHRIPQGHRIPPLTPFAAKAVHRMLCVPVKHSGVASLERLGSVLFPQPAATGDPIPHFLFRACRSSHGITSWNRSQEALRCLTS